jgi:streptomycin 6-kinase
MLNLSPAFVRRISSTFEPDGAPWLAALPGLIEQVARRWGLRVAPPFPDLTYNYVAPARLADGTPVVLKLGVPRAELASEIDALRHYGGQGACRLLDADEALGALLLERLEPGATLAPLAAADDEAATRIAAGVMARLWRPPPAGHRYPAVADWFAGLAELRATFGGGTGPFPHDLVERAETLAAELLATQGEQVVLHGDLHHANILDAGGVWRAIDPKGIVGERAYEPAALLRNPTPQIAAHPRLAELLDRRIAVFAEALGLAPERIHGWALANAVLSAWWSYEDGEAEPDLTVARALDRLVLRPSKADG